MDGHSSNNHQQTGINVNAIIFLRFFARIRCESGCPIVRVHEMKGQEIELGFKEKGDRLQEWMMFRFNRFDGGNEH